MLQILAFASLARIQRFVPNFKIPSCPIRHGPVAVSSHIGFAECSLAGKRWTIAEFRLDHFLLVIRSNPDSCGARRLRSPKANKTASVGDLTPMPARHERIF